MTPRQRYIETLTFGNPDRIPFAPGGPRESTIANWHKQGLPEGVKWRPYLLEMLGIVEDPPRQQEVSLGVRILAQMTGWL